jgi:hypothetical protein
MNAFEATVLNHTNEADKVTESLQKKKYKPHKEKKNSKCRSPKFHDGSASSERALQIQILYSKNEKEKVKLSV